MRYIKVCVCLVLFSFVFCNICSSQSLRSQFDAANNTAAKKRQKSDAAKARAGLRAKDKAQYSRAARSARTTKTHKPASATHASTVRKYAVTRREICVFDLKNGGKAQGVIVKETSTHVFIKDGDFTIELAKDTIKKQKNVVRNVYNRY